MSVQKLIIDCDPGTDDAQAILIALASKNIEVIAITTVFGNTYVENTTRNALRLLKYFNRTEIPVYKGCDKSLLSERCCGDGYHGPDGFGGVKLANVDPVDLSEIPSEHASAALCRLVSENPGKITLLAIGPLTNIAVALMLDSEFGTKLKDCVIMGGNYKGRGNITPSAEFNWFCDPAAVHSVLENMGSIITVVPFETCLEFSFSWDWYNSASSQPTRGAQFIKTIDAVTVEIERSQKSTIYHAWDQLAAAIVVDPAVVIDAPTVRASVELHGQTTRGQAVVDWTSKLGKPANVRMVTNIDKERYLQIVATAYNYE